MGAGEGAGEGEGVGEGEAEGEGEGVGEGEGEGEGKDEGDVSCSLLEHEAGVLLALAALGPVDTGWLRVGVA